MNIDVEICSLFAFISQPSQNLKTRCVFDNLKTTWMWKYCSTLREIMVDFGYESCVLDPSPDLFSIREIFVMCRMWLPISTTSTLKAILSSWRMSTVETTGKCKILAKLAFERWKVNRLPELNINKIVKFVCETF